MGNVEKVYPFEAGLKQEIADTLKQYNTSTVRLYDSVIDFTVFTPMGQKRCRIVNYRDHIRIMVYDYERKLQPINQSPKHADCIKILTAIMNGLAGKLRV